MHQALRGKIGVFECTNTSHTEDAGQMIDEVVNTGIALYVLSICMLSVAARYQSIPEETTELDLS